MMCVLRRCVWPYSRLTCKWQWLTLYTSGHRELCDLQIGRSLWKWSDSPGLSGQECARMHACKWTAASLEHRPFVHQLVLTHCILLNVFMSSVCKMISVISWEFAATSAFFSCSSGYLHVCLHLHVLLTWLLSPRGKHPSLFIALWEVRPTVHIQRQMD